MKKSRLVHAALASGLLFPFLPALAQDGAGGFYMVFGVDQRLEAGDNLSLDTPEEGDTLLSTTSLSFDLVSENRTQALKFGGGVKIRAGELPSTSDVETGLVEPDVYLSYARDGANARLEVDGNYRETDVAFQPTLASFADPITGVIVLPPDFEDLRGSGIRRNYSFSTMLQTGIDAPLGFVFDAGVDGTTYKDASSSALNDVFRYNYGAEARARITPVTTSFIGYDMRHFESDDAQNTERFTHEYEIGAEQELSERATLEGAVGYSETTETLSGVRTTTSGLTGRLSYMLDMPNGNADASYDTTRDQDGARHTLRFGRSVELPTGGLSVMVGATQKGGSDVAMIGSVDWTRDLPTGRIKLGAERKVSISNEDEERITTAIDFGYSHEINEISSLGFNMTFGLSEGNSTANETQRTDISATYNRDITEDWQLTTGVTYKVRDEDTAGRSDSTSVFVSIGRDFTILR